MPRYTKINGVGQWFVPKEFLVTGGMARGEAIDKLARLETAEEEKRLIELPVPLGTKVFRLSYSKFRNDFCVIPVSGFCLADLDAWGIDVFPTKADAEKEILRRKALGKAPKTFRFCPSCGSVDIHMFRLNKQATYIAMCGHCEAVTYPQNSPAAARKAWNTGELAGRGILEVH